MNSEFRKILKQYVKDQLNNEIDNKLMKEEFLHGLVKGNKSEYIVQMIAEEICNTERMQDMIDIVIKRLNKSIINDDDDHEHSGLQILKNESEIIKSDDLLLLEDWCPSIMKTPQIENNLGKIFDDISRDKTAHIRLAGFEALYENDLSNNCNNEAFGILLALLRDGIDDDNKSIVQASLKLHCKLLQTARSHDVYSNLLNFLEAQYHSDNSNKDKFPNLNSGINFKIFFHEKLMRILYIIIKHQKEMLKLSRNAERTIEEMIDEFVIFLTIHNQPNDKYMSILNLVSLIEPYANWCAKWIYSIPTRRTFIASLSKSPSLLKSILNIVHEGQERAISSKNIPVYSITDDIILQSTYHQSSVFISGETANLMTYLHCLNIVGQISNYISPLDLSFSPSDLLLKMIEWLNLLTVSTTASKSLYNYSHGVLKLMLNQPTLQFNSTIGQAILYTFLHEFSIEDNNIHLWPHTIDTIDFALNSTDGLTFFASQYETLTSPITQIIPISIILRYLSSLLLQPIAVMDIDHVLIVLQLVTKIFQTIDHFDIIYEDIQLQLYPAIEYFFNKIDKYTINQNNIARLSSGIRSMLVHIVNWPLGLKALSEYSVTFEELIRGSMNPFKNSLNSNETVSLLSAVTYFDVGIRLVRDLLPQTISTTLAQINQSYYNEKENTTNINDEFYIKKFIHVLSLFSLNTQCFAVYMMEGDVDEEEIEYPKNLMQLFKHSTLINSPFHYLSLLSLDALIWNLDILIYLLNSFDLQTKLLELQNSCRMTIIKYKKNEEDSPDCATNNSGESHHDLYIIDQSSMLRHEILSKSYFIRHKLKTLTYDHMIPEKSLLFSSFPPPILEKDDYDCMILDNSSSELDDLLQGTRAGLRDSAWVMHIRKAYNNSCISLKHSTFLSLLNQMERAIAAVEWADMFKWNYNETKKNYRWLCEENTGLELVLRFAEDHCENIDNKLKTANNLRQIFQEIHAFIKYDERKDYFEMFDWFLGTVFIICDGHADRCKILVKNLVRFPSAIYMWRIHGISFDTNRGKKQNTAFLLNQQINSIVMQELPIVDHALMKEFGIKWWMVCNQLLSQCFWGVLEWSEIVHFFTICILYPPDYIVYFCVSLLQHCKTAIYEDILNNKYWPENINLMNYQCHQYMNYMDQLAKKYQNHILHSLNQSQLIVCPTEYTTFEK